MRRSRHAATHYLEQMTGVGSTAKKQDERAVLTSLHDIGRGPIIAKFSQEFSGVEVFNRELNVLMDRDLNMVAVPDTLPTLTRARRARPNFDCLARRSQHSLQPATFRVSG